MELITTNDLTYSRGYVVQCDWTSIRLKLMMNPCRSLQKLQLVDSLGRVVTSQAFDEDQMARDASSHATWQNLSDLSSIRRM